MEPQDKHVERAKAIADAWREIATIVENNPDPDFLDALDYALTYVSAPVGGAERGRQRITAVIAALQAVGVPLTEWSDDVHGGVVGQVGRVALRLFARREFLGRVPAKPEPPAYAPLLGKAVES